MKPSPGHTLCGNVPENLIGVERRRAAGRRLCRTDFGPAPIHGATGAFFPLRTEPATFKLRDGFRAEG